MVGRGHVGRGGRRVRLGRRFNRLWAASAAGNLGDGVHQVAIALLAARLTSDPVAFSVLTALGFVPWLVLGLPSGVLVDRHDRRRLALLVGVVRVGVISALLVAVVLDRASLWLLYTMVLVLGAGETVYDNAVGSMVPAVVGDRERLETANGRLQGAGLLAQDFVGPPLASAVFAVAAGAAFGINVACFAVAAVLMAALPGTYRAGGEQPARITQAMGQALRFVRGHRVHRVMLSVVVVLGFANAMAMAIVVLWTREILGIGEAAYGVFLLTAAAGALLGSQTAARVAAWTGRGRAMALSAVVTGLGMLLAAATRSPYVAAFGFALSGWAILLWNVVYGSLRQRLTPDALLGRTIGVYRVVAWGVMPLGAICGGVLAKVGDLRTPILVAAVLTLAAGGYATLRLTNAGVDAAISTADEAARRGNRGGNGAGQWWSRRSVIWEAQQDGAGSVLNDASSVHDSGAAGAVIRWAVTCAESQWMRGRSRLGPKQASSSARVRVGSVNEMTTADSPARSFTDSSSRAVPGGEGCTNSRPKSSWVGAGRPSRAATSAGCSVVTPQMRRDQVHSRSVVIGRAIRSSRCAGAGGRRHTVGQSSRSASSVPSTMRVYRGAAGKSFTRTVRVRPSTSAWYGNSPSPECSHRMGVAVRSLMTGSPQIEREAKWTRTAYGVSASPHLRAVTTCTESPRRALASLVL